MEPKESATTDASSETIEKILLAAEAGFAEHGFDGAGMKALSKRANVSQALLHYHFGTKDNLYSEVIRQRSKKINAARNALLKQVDLRAPNAIDGIFDALFRPPLGPEGGEKPYARIFSGLVVGREREQVLVKECYDENAQLFIAALQSASPGLDRETAATCYTLALGSLIAVIARDGRLERLMQKPELQETEEILGHLVRFARGGVLSLASTKTN